MGVLAKFVIVDYDGQRYDFYRFGDGHPCERQGVFANFPLGDRDFLLETYIRKLNLEKSPHNYFIDVRYEMDLRSRQIEVSSGCYEDCDFKGTFEEAVRHFAWENYVEKEALSIFPNKSDLEPILIPGFLDGLWVIVDAVCKNFPYLKYDAMSSRKLYIGDNINFYMYDDFILYPYNSINMNCRAVEDAYSNARRVGVRLYFNNQRSGKPFTLLYMLGVRSHGYILPLTDKRIRYGEGLDEQTKKQELLILVEFLKTRDLETRTALNILDGICYGEELGRIRESVMGGGD